MNTNYIFGYKQTNTETSLLNYRNHHATVMAPSGNFELLKKYTGKTSGFQVTLMRNLDDNLFYIFYNGQDPWDFEADQLWDAYRFYYDRARMLIADFEDEALPEPGTVIARDEFPEFNTLITTTIGQDRDWPFITEMKNIVAGAELSPKVHGDFKNTFLKSLKGSLLEEGLENHEYLVKELPRFGERGLPALIW